MNQPSALSSSVIPTWVDASQLAGMLRGIERESLRMQSNGFLSQKNHPIALGSALTHPHITTDYSEALMEFITTPHSTIAAALDELRDIHHVVHQHLQDGEKLWPLSMPCMLDDHEENIRLAQYGTSNIGRFKTLYRHGLGVRYGRRMQTISGVHYNLSFPDQLFEDLQQHETNAELKQLSLQDYRSHRYFGLIRNFIRLTPLVMYLLGASPSVCRCFLTGREHHLQALIKGTLYLPEATALRMGRLGYQNSAQKQLGIHYNDLHDYLEGLQKAVHTPYPQFTALGLDDEQGEPIQINDHVLQIENEYYSLIRPKQVPEQGETPSQALKNRGVGYVELRAVDVNPYRAIGIDETAAGFLESLALYCLLNDSPELWADEQDQIDLNQTEIVNRGRAADAKIKDGPIEVPFQDWAQRHLGQIQACAILLDQMDRTSLYQDAVQVMQHRLYQVENTLSEQVINDTLQHGGTWNFGSIMAQQHVQDYEQHQISLERKQYFEHLAQTSLQKQSQLEQDNHMSFAEYLAQYR
ncbi:MULTISPECIES: glutamate--cysteine ligase [Acinetobacter]|uniref:Glutamate--cysteine ligase n=2 Tax=Acinetobacter haemolyticus TaxID=29430 RepID=A0A372MVT7_ACIHA|nr:glutamate--cysteine ligase [Acinetobacter haemolyticus]ENW20386.1 glutamate-cysteine ligase [Acinetobacter haemolyticus CIP 64.3 = MTCC 9819]ENW22155.1 glutamate-cysteine ligase [Acinetobacter haemolyticus NIPH 261]EPR89703.1 Glutamate--cysteine ligase [Acinetobacter haemolyticus CIP 64.3 = MTCC 9819]MBO3659091.1 glutamate--cysteine ligase [Acinetobacter haemolyticus]MCU4377206.1 glutamate--cysteine ligase [Acinetobacter haemolyticus]